MTRCFRHFRAAKESCSIEVVCRFGVDLGFFLGVHLWTWSFQELFYQKFFARRLL